MACRALHSHLLLGLMMIHATIIVYLFVSQMYFLYPKKWTPPDVTTVSPSSKKSDKEEDLDLNALKVIVAIAVHISCFLIAIGALIANDAPAVTRRMPPIVVVVTLSFSLIFNIIGALCLWFHEAPHYPGGFSRTIRTCKILSTTTAVYTIPIILIFCLRPPSHDSLKALADAQPKDSQDKLSAEGKSKEKTDQKSSEEIKNKEKKKDIQEPSPVDYWSSPEPAKGAMPPPPILPPPPPPPPAPAGPTDGKGEGLYENLEVPPGFVAPPPPPPPP